ncbi:MAG: serine hydrolase domain-containing protein [Crocinitomicaceae bacterium]|nr:serine hydrolase domain-containing protein [Crocinitomicaceae bacterium]
MTRLLSIVFLLLSFSSVAQLSHSDQEAIDSLFTEWNESGHPGGVVGVQENGDLVYLKSYGLANVEHNVSNETSTVFNIASISKQFTAMSIIILEEQGKLSITDDVHKFIPELPDFGQTITIEHLIYHTSGLRSVHGMLQLAGWRDDDARTTEDILRFTKKQRELNFLPGEEFAYCNTGYNLMALIVERISEQTFADWMKENIFTPLGMNSAFVEPIYNNPGIGVATSYEYVGEQIVRPSPYWGYQGSGNMHSDAEDLLKWLENFHSPKTGWEERFKKMTSLGALNNDEQLDYAYGLFINQNNNLERVSHSGAIGGYRAYAATFPEKNLDLVILTNFSTSNVNSNIDALAKIVLKSENDETPLVVREPIKLSTKKLNEFTGDFWSSEDLLSRTITMKNDSLFLDNGHAVYSLLPISKTELIIADIPVDVVASYTEDKKSLKFVVNEESGASYVRYDLFTPDENYLNELSGEYYSEELETSYFLRIEEGKFIIYHSRHGVIEPQLIVRDVFTSDWPIESMKIIRDDAGKTIGIRLSNSRARNLFFKKVN